MKKEEWRMEYEEWITVYGEWSMEKKENMENEQWNM